MNEVFLQPRISPLLVARIEDYLLKTREDREDIHEGLKSLADEKGTISWEQYQQQRKEQELRGELSG